MAPACSKLGQEDEAGRGLVVRRGSWRMDPFTSDRGRVVTTQRFRRRGFGLLAVGCAAVLAVSTAGVATAGPSGPSVDQRQPEARQAALKVGNSPKGGWASVSASLFHTCAIRVDGSLWCWGSNIAGELGDGTTKSRTRPVRVHAEGTWASVDTGWAYTCGVQTDATLWCWGNNYRGKLGNGGNGGHRALPLQVGSDNDWATVSTGRDHTCGTRADGTLWCWGDDYYGQVGDGKKKNRGFPVQVGRSSTWGGVSAGGESTCARRTVGTLWCWGWNRLGQLGDGTTTDRRTPVRIGGATNWTTVDMSIAHACGARADGTAWCWGQNDHGEIGDGTTIDRLTPTQVSGDTGWAEVRTYYQDQGSDGQNSCGTRHDGTIWCWGSNDAGQLGDRTQTERHTPVQVGSRAGWATVSPGSYYTCATRTVGTLLCWGFNGWGQLGDGTYDNHLVPKRVRMPR